MKAKTSLNLPKLAFLLFAWSCASAIVVSDDHGPRHTIQTCYLCQVNAFEYFYNQTKPSHKNFVERICINPDSLKSYLAQGNYRLTNPHRWMQSSCVLDPDQVTR